MPFDWMNAHIPERPARGREMFLKAIEERAVLLFGLRYPQAEAVTRIQDNLRWEFDSDIASTPLPDFYDQVPEIVARAYKRKS